MNLTLSGTFLFPMETPLSVKLCTEHGDTESDALCASLKLSFKHPDAGRDWGQEEKGMTEDEMVGWHH